MASIDPTDVQEALSGLEYPASKEELVQQARQNEADEEVVNFLERIDDGNYDSPTEVQAELGKMDEGQRMPGQDMGAADSLDMTDQEL